MITATRNRKIIPLLIIFAALVCATQTRAETTEDETTLRDVEQETTELLRTLNEYGVDQRDEAVRKTEDALQNLDRRIDALETRIDRNWEQMDRAAREKARASLRALRRQRTRVAEWYGGLKSSSADAWVHMKTGFTNAYRALSDAWEKSRLEFGEPQQGKP